MNTCGAQTSVSERMCGFESHFRYMIQLNYNKRIGYDKYSLGHFYRIGGSYENSSKMKMFIEVADNTFVERKDFQILYDSVNPELKEIKNYTLNYNYLHDILVIIKSK